MGDNGTIIVNGERWIRCAAEYESDGKKYGFEFYALSLDHAAVVIQDIRETAVLSGTHCHEVKP